MECMKKKKKKLTGFKPDPILGLDSGKIEYATQCRALMEISIFYYYFEYVGLHVFMPFLMLMMN